MIQDDHGAYGHQNIGTVAPGSHNDHAASVHLDEKYSENKKVWKAEYNWNPRNRVRRKVNAGN